MRIIGVDPGLTRCGLAVVEVDPGRKVRLLTVEVVKSDHTQDLGVRLWGVERAIDRLITEYHPDALAIERVFSQHNVRTVMGTAQAAGIAALVAARRAVPVAFHTPSEVKAAVTGSGRADKKQVATMVGRIVAAQVEGPADATDAVALAICHGWRAPVRVATRVVDSSSATVSIRKTLVPSESVMTTRTSQEGRR
ncbi:MAG: crossover junction endodeoxyribonuclease RuvC [Actinomycetes bacterium]